MKPKRPYQVLGGVGAFVALIVAAGLLLTNRLPVIESGSKGLGSWSERLGEGEVFPACGSSYVYETVFDPLPCSTPPNSCGMREYGVIGYDGACTVETPPDSSCPAPSVVLAGSAGASSPTIDAGQSAELTWDSPDAVSCQWTGGFETATVGRSGSISTGPLTDTATYGICCAYASGVCGPRSQLTITVLHPSIDLKAEPLRVRPGGTSTITWSTSDVRNCTITRNGVAYSSPSGASDTVATQTTYVLTCETNGDPLTKSVQVNTVPVYGEF